MEVSADTKRNWVVKHAESIISSFDKWKSPLGISPEYHQLIEEQLSKDYDNPLKRSLIETSYPYIP
jgi:hypothetical protein